MTTGERIRLIREERGLSQTELGRAAFPWLSEKSAQSKMKRLEKGQEPRMAEVEAIAQALDRPVAEILPPSSGPRAPGPGQPRPVPVISWVAAGGLAEAEDPWPMGYSGEGEPVATRKKVGPNAFALHIRGDSMMPRYMDGDIIVVDPSIEAVSGDPCVAKLNGEVTFKFLVLTEKEIRLRPMNDCHPDIVIPKSGNVEFHIIGKVVDHIPAPVRMAS
jgi:SOS-response transcriptional repressor LexA